MKLTKKTIELICELERIIGNECYNPNSLNGYTLEEGCEFRYPICYIDKDNADRKTWFEVKNINAKGINSMRYKFGSNHLYIGSGIYKVLEHLEQIYGLNFDELANQRKKTKEFPGIILNLD